MAPPLPQGLAEMPPAAGIRRLWGHTAGAREWLETRSAVAKLSLLGAGYLLAVLVAVGVVAMHVATTSGADRDASGGMHAFGDFLLFLVAFGAASLAPTAVSIYLLRRSTVFWSFAAALALALAAASLTSVSAWFMSLHFPGSIAKFTIWEAMTIPVFVASPFMLACFGAAMLAAPAGFRVALGLAAAMEGICATYALVWLIGLFVLERSI